MSSKNIRLTKHGIEKIKKELNNLKERHLTLSKLWRSSGKDSNDIQHAVELLDHAEASRQIVQLEEILRNAKPIGANQKDESVKKIGLGSVVMLKSSKDKKKVTLVESIEADPFSGFISHKSPLGQAVLGRRVGEKAMVESPKGQEEYTILSIS